MTGGRIAFRSDSRHPTQNRIFFLGFKCWRPQKKVSTAKAYRKRSDGTAGDIDSQYAVCLSQRVSGAALFPFGKKISEDTWMYMVFVPTGEEFSTHNKQIADGIILAQTDPGKAWWPLYAHEIAVKEVRRENIIAAVKCDRSQKQSFTLIGNILVNTGCSVSDTYKGPAMDFLKGEVSLGNQMRAQLESGFHASKK